jgi:hypothetical protein
MDVRTFVNDALHEQLTEGRSLEVGYATHGLLLADLEVWGRANYGAFIDE